MQSTKIENVILEVDRYQTNLKIVYSQRCNAGEYEVCQCLADGHPSAAARIDQALDWLLADRRRPTNLI